MKGDTDRQTDSEEMRVGRRGRCERRYRQTDSEEMRVGRRGRCERRYRQTDRQ